MESTSDHTFNPKSASPALKRAISDLAARTDRPEASFAGIRLGDAYALAQETYGDQMPDFWKVWATWNDAPDDAAPWGDL